MPDAPKTFADLVIPYDQFQISGYIGWIESNGFKPHLAVDTRHEGVVLPPQCMAKPIEVINAHSQAISRMTWDDTMVSFNARFGGRDFRVRIPYRSIQVILFHGTDMMIPMPWAVRYQSQVVEATDEPQPKPQVEQAKENALPSAAVAPADTGGTDETNVVRPTFGQPRSK